MTNIRLHPRHLLTLLAGAMALSACGQPAPLSPPPSQTLKSLGLYELNINGVGRNQVQAAVKAAGPGLTAQASEIGGLSFALLSNSTVADNVNRVLHITTSFTVTNNSGAPIALPTYIPVDTAGSYATDAETPFRNVVSRLGTPISPAGMTIERARQVSGGVVQEDPNATPLVAGLDTGALQLSLPAGTTAPGISHQGWQTTTLAAGASQIVNFAIKVPLQGADVGDNDPFRFSLVFAVADNPGTVAGLTSIDAVQGSTPSGDAASPKSGQTVTVEGVVTSVNTANVTGSLKGFFLQEEGIDADQDAASSEGIFIFCNTTCPTDLVPGDRVRVTGSVSEFVTSTQITMTSLTKVATGIPLPAVVPLTLPLDYAARERFEDMLVSTSGVVTNNFTLGRGGSFDIADSRIMNFTQINAPSVSGNSAYQQQVKNRFIRVDDGTRAQNPDPVIFADNGQPLSAANTLRGGDTVTVTGVLGFGNDGWTSGTSGSLDTYRIQATQANVNIQPTNARTATPDAVGGTLRVGSMNVLNFFTTLATSNSGCTPNGVDTVNSRGADNCTEFDRQRTKIVKAILGLNPDVLGILEMQNDFDKGANSSIANLVNALNTQAGAGTYTYINPGKKIGGDVISVAMIYKPAAVDPVGKLAILDNTVDSTYVDTCNRPTWAQTFQSKANGGRFTAVMMHLKSKGSACAALGDADTGDGQGNSYQARAQAATAIVNWLGGNPTGVTEDDRILMGDYNAYEMETPLTILAGGGYQNLFTPDMYSYQFDGQWGSIDHATVSSSMAAQVTGKTKWHINSDEPTVLDYNTEFKSAGQISSFYAPDQYRASDHDPVLVGLNLTAQTPIPPPSDPTTSLSANPSTLNLTVGGAGQNSTVTPSTQNYTGGNFTVTTSNSAGLTVSAPATTAPNTAFTVTVTAPTGVTPGTYPVTVTTTGDAGLTASTTINVTVSSAPTQGAVNHLVISQVYGGGGNSGATYKNDFVELFNPTTSAISLSGMTIQYTSTTGAFGTNTFTLPTAASVAPGAYFLVQMAAGTGGTTDLPTPDAIGTLALSGTGGKVALANNGTAVSGPTAPNVIDFVGWGSATTFEGSGAAPATTNTTAVLRAGNGCTDTNTNSADFTTAAPAPRNSASPTTSCP